MASRFARIYTAAVTDVLRRCERLVGTEGRVRLAVKRGMRPLTAYERYGAF